MRTFIDNREGSGKKECTVKVGRRDAEGVHYSGYCFLG